MLHAFPRPIGTQFASADARAFHTSYWVRRTQTAVRVRSAFCVSGATSACAKTRVARVLSRACLAEHRNFHISENPRTYSTWGMRARNSLARVNANERWG